MNCGNSICMISTFYTDKKKGRGDGFDVRVERVERVETWRANELW